MTVNIKNVIPGNRIRFAFGAVGNDITILVTGIQKFEKQIIVYGDGYQWQRDFSFNPDETVELLEGVGANV